jgi:hypothetical protein
MGGWLIYDGAAILIAKAAAPTTTGSGSGGSLWAALSVIVRVIAVILVMLGAVCVLLGALGVLAGAGTLRRKQWGRILALILAVPAFLVGLLALSEADGAAPLVVVGATHLLYGVLAVIILIRYGAEFSRLQGPGNNGEQHRDISVLRTGADD